MRNLHANEPFRDRLRSYFATSPLGNLSSRVVTVERDLAGSDTSGKLLRTRSSSTYGKGVRTGKLPASVGYKNHAKTEQNKENSAHTSIINTSYNTSRPSAVKLKINMSFA